jgi:hypothetical protein
MIPVKTAGLSNAGANAATSSPVPINPNQKGKMKIELQIEKLSEATLSYFRFLAFCLLIILWTWFLYLISLAVIPEEMSDFASFLTFLSFAVTWVAGIIPLIHFVAPNLKL